MALGRARCCRMRLPHQQLRSPREPSVTPHVRQIRARVRFGYRILSSGARAARRRRPTFMNLPSFPSVSCTGDVMTPDIDDSMFSFLDLRRPPPSLGRWVSGSKIPLNARAVMERCGLDIDTEGLLRVLVKSPVTDDYEAVWLLARSGGRLVSIVVRDARTVGNSHLCSDQHLAVEQAKRYCAAFAFVFVQAPTHRTSQIGDVPPTAPSEVSAREPVRYFCADEGNIRVWRASLTTEE